MKARYCLANFSVQYVILLPLKCKFKLFKVHYISSALATKDLIQKQAILANVLSFCCKRSTKMQNFILLSAKFLTNQFF